MLGTALPPEPRAVQPGPALRTCPPHATASPEDALAMVWDSTTPPGRQRGPRRPLCRPAWVGRAMVVVVRAMPGQGGIWGEAAAHPALLFTA